jgi:hydrogenase/urease accessory protein HupE
MKEQAGCLAPANQSDVARRRIQEVRVLLYRRCARFFVGFVLAVLIGCGSARAHEIGKTQAIAVIHANTYTVDVIVDPDALLTKLEVFSGAELSTGVTRGERDQRIGALASVFLNRVTLRFDETVVRSQFEYMPESALGDVARSPSRVRLTGRVPPGARAVTFAYGLALGAYAFNVRIGDGPVQSYWVDGVQSSPAISLIAPPPPLTARQVAWQYFALGYTHIVPKGTDHILFVLGIFLLSARWRSIVLQVSTFTVAHSITLGLTMYGVVSLPARIVEPMIALSIAYVALENIVTSELKPWRLALVFSFGLLHGMGFAGVLRELGLPHSQYLNALGTFNIGVEAGQLSVIGVAYLAVAALRRNELHYRKIVVQPASLAIAFIGLYWTIQRIVM